MKLISLVPWLMSMLLLALMPAEIAIGQDQASETGATRSAQRFDPVIEVVSAVGEPRMTAADGDRDVLEAGASVSLESTIETDAESRVALSVARSPELPPNRADVVVLGPQARLRLTKSGASESAAASGGRERVEAVLESGSVRIVVRSPQNRASLQLRVSGDAVSFDRADAIVSIAPEAGVTTFLVQGGKATIEHGERHVRISEGMMRRIEGDRVLGARPCPEQRWREAIERTSVPGTNVTRDVPKGDDRASQPTGASRSTGTPRVEPNSTPSAAAAGPADADQLVYVQMITSMGTIALELDRSKAPITVDNFLAYVDRGFYDQTLFHRIIPPGRNIAIIQGGGLTTDWQEKKTGDPIRNEWENGLKNVRGSIAMARHGAPDTATSQFFINVSDNLVLDRPAYGGAAYCVFGRVIGGMDVVDRIAGVPTGRVQGRSDAPLEPIIIETVKRIDGKPPAE
jgi:cyclophilin family peptidyl-prolyl cis-trans isomerase